MKKVTSADQYYDSTVKYTEELKTLRSIFLKSGLVETIKWGAPVYQFNGENVVATCEFKNHFGIWFYQGALLTDHQNKLINASPEKTKALRQWRMTGKLDIDEPQILQFIYESIENFKQGKKITADRNKPLEIPVELKSFLENNKEHASQFDGLNLTKKREFCEYIESAKRLETKIARLSKIGPMILEGIGLNDKYR